MALIDSIVDIKISRNTLGITKEEFGTILVIGEPVPLIDIPKVGLYASLTAVLVDYAVDTYEYQMARNIFIQDITVKNIYITQRSNAETLLQAYERMRLIYNFYAVCASNDIHADIMPLANAIEASRTSGQSNILILLEEDPAVDADSDMSKAYVAALSRTSVWYSNRPNPTPPDVTISYIQAALLGRMLPTDPGTNNWSGKTIKGIAPDSATDGGLTNAIISKINSLNGNFYTNVAGRDITFNGKMASGEYIDIIYGIDWLEHTMQQDVFTVFATNPKIPYTNQGIGLIENAMRASLELAKSRGVISSYTVTTPDITTVSFTDKSNRDLKGVTFEAIATGAINHVFINGYVTL
jgi:hypothetical protein